MYRLQTISMMMCLVIMMAGSVFAQDSGPLQSGSKDSGHVLQNPGTPDGRQGGEDIFDAFPIPSLPFLDTGNTCDNVNDYDEVCPYSGSTSPDVVYAYDPPVDMVVMLDLCSEGNQYDTKIYVYCEGPGSLVACNDDACSNSWTPYASRLEYVQLLAGFTYYIVIDGYGGDCGDYELLIEESLPQPPVECGPDHVPEGEPALIEGYVDNYNGGCNSTPEIFQDINWIDPSSECAQLCGVSGWYDMPSGLYRDSDWFWVMAAEFQIDVAINSEHFTQVLISGPNPTCATVIWDIVQTFNANTPTFWSLPTNPGEDYWIWVGPAEWVDLPDFIYDLKVCGAYYDVLPTETTSWGIMKNRYR